MNILTKTKARGSTRPLTVNILKAVPVQRKDVKKWLSRMVYRVGGCWRRVPGQKKGLSSFSRLGTRDSGRRSLGARFAFVSAITFLFSLLLIWDSLGCSSLPFELSPFVSPLPVDSRRSLNYQAARYRETRDSKGLSSLLSFGQLSYIFPIQLPTERYSYFSVWDWESLQDSHQQKYIRVSVLSLIDNWYL